MPVRILVMANACTDGTVRAAESFARRAEARARGPGPVTGRGQFVGQNWFRGIPQENQDLIFKILQAQERELEARRSRLSSEQRGLTPKLQRVVNEGSTMVALDAVVKARAVLETQREKGEIPSGIQQQLIDDLEQALYASKIVSYAQGYMLMRAAAREYGWNLNYGGIALMWRGGCIIRSVFLGKIKEAFDNDPDLVNLLLDPFFRDAVVSAQDAWRRVVVSAVELGIPVPAISSALAFYDGYRSERLPANLLQAQRDYFGAHTYERIDRPRGEFFHTNWTGEGGDVTATTYDA